MGRKRKTELEKMQNLRLNIKGEILEEMKKDGKPKHVAENLINNKYTKKP